MTSYLDGILRHHRERASQDARSLEALIDEAAASPAPRGFAEALGACDGLAVIAEVKRRSPSAGDIRPDLNPARLSAVYRRGGAAALSVLTDEAHFGGSPGDLAAAREASGLPVLRKDFTVCLADVCDARIMGADAVLFIVAALSDAEIRDFLSLAGELGLDALVETHDAAEIDRAASLGASLIGVNQRDLRRFTVDRGRAARLAGLLPPSAVKVAESGIRDAADAAEVARSGYDAVLVGESLLRLPEPDSISAAIADLRCAKQ